MAQTIKDYILGIIGFTFLVVGSLFVVNSFYALNPNLADAPAIQEFDKTFNQSKSLNDSIEGLRSSITEGGQNPDALGMLNALITTAWNTLKTIFTSFGFMLTAIQGLSSTMFGFQIPVWATSLAIAALVVIIVFAVYRAIFQSE